jgi:hypothetical protein
MSGSSGPTILWDHLKEKKVKTNDGKDVGEIKEISPNHLRLEKGTISKDKFWIPKYIVDTFDGKNVWLSEPENEVKERYLFGQEPSNEQFTRDFETFRKTKGTYVSNSEGVVIRTNSNQDEEPIPPSSSEKYKNIRDLDK